MSKLRSIFRPLFSKFRCGFLLSSAIIIRKYPKTLRRFSYFASTAFLSWFLTANQDSSFPTHFDAEKQISQLIGKAEQCILEEKLSEAKNILISALAMADENQAYGSLTYMCDLITSIVLSQGELHEAENLLVKFTEKLLQLGYPETHNSIVKFKLKLARLYQLLGSQEMAEYGFKDCIGVQEKKMETMKPLDEETNGIYLTALFWYAKLLTDQQQYTRARKEYKKCLDRISKAASVLPSQKMVVLHNIASVSALLKDFDGALNYLFDAIEICLLEDPSNPDLPIYVVQVGLIYLQKGVFEGAQFWCQTGLSLASHEGNQLAETEGQKCIEELRRLKILQ